MALRVSLQSNGCELAGWFRQAIRPRTDIPVLLLQGFPGGGDDTLGLGHRLAGYGISSLTYCHRGMSPSGGTFFMSHEPADIDAALAFLRNPENAELYAYDPAKLVIGGYSYGGGNALAYAAHNPDIRRVFAVSGTDHGELIRAIQADSKLEAQFRAMFRQIGDLGQVAFEGYPEYMLDFMLGNPPHLAYLDLKPQAPELAQRDVLLVCTWDEYEVNLEHQILPLYRALQAAGAERLRIAGFQDTHGYEHSGMELARVVAEWVLGTA